MNFVFHVFSHYDCMYSTQCRAGTQVSLPMNCLSLSASAKGGPWLGINENQLQEAPLMDALEGLTRDRA